MSAAFLMRDWRRLLGPALTMPIPEGGSEAVVVAFRRKMGPTASMVMLDVEGAGWFLFGALMEDWSTRPSALGPFIERLRFYRYEWHIQQGLARLCKAAPKRDAETAYTAWEVHPVGSSLLQALHGPLSDLSLSGLAGAVAYCWRRNSAEKEAIKRRAEESGCSFERMLQALCESGSALAIADLRANDTFRVDTARRSHELVLPEIARAFRSRAIRYAREDLGIERKSKQRGREVLHVPMSEAQSLAGRPGSTALDLLIARERVDELYRLAKDDVDRRLLEARADGMNESAAARAVAQEMRIAFDTARKRLQRLEKRARAG